MNRQLGRESTKVLRQYTSGSITLGALSEWLAQAEYDDDLSLDERNLLAGVRLTAIEAAEGLVPETNVIESISSLLGAQPTRVIG